ncbi:hypothetical protein ACMFMG_009384 [Clarireedia jacksonii]
MPKLEIYFGTGTFGVNWSKGQLLELFTALKSHEIKRIDTAALYPAVSPGLAEKILGEDVLDGLKQQPHIGSAAQDFNSKIACLRIYLRLPIAFPFDNSIAHFETMSVDADGENIATSPVCTAIELQGIQLVMSVGMGMLTTLKYDSSIRLILGYQVPAGVGIGVILQQTVLAAQTILAMDDFPIRVSLMVLAQTLGSTIALFAANADKWRKQGYYRG